MRMRRRTVGFLMLTVVVTITAALAMGAGEDRPYILFSAEGEVVISKVKIIPFDQTVARFDRTTGAIMKYNGDFTNPYVRGQWRPHVPPVKEPTSGLLEIQQPELTVPGVTFLVDAITGDTWVLRRRGGTNQSSKTSRNSGVGMKSNANWEKVETFYR